MEKYLFQFQKLILVQSLQNINRDHKIKAKEKHIQNLFKSFACAIIQRHSILFEIFAINIVNTLFWVDHNV